MSRYEHRKHLDEALHRPLDAEAAEDYDRALWESRNVTPDAAEAIAGLPGGESFG